jgi:hypothetical protein
MMKKQRTFEAFTKFLRNIFCKRKNKTTFLSTNSYIGYVQNICRDLGIRIEIFLSASFKMLQVWKQQLGSNRPFQSRSAYDKRNLGAGLNAFIAFVKFDSDSV